MSLYSNLAATAKKLLTKYGQLVTLKQNTGKSFDPVAGEYSGGSLTSTAVRGALFSYDRSEVDGENIIDGDARLYLTSDVAPVAGDKVTIQGVDWHIVGVISSAPAGTTVYHNCQVRK